MLPICGKAVTCLAFQPITSNEGELEEESHLAIGSADRTVALLSVAAASMR